ncbi:LysR family transcriptional regulator [Secundilactobacillus pentosiphilus]|uniref:LysR family transcriptional regulator n=1 Tax=Secundilactobacillus pentosiphilus TaxID=1714682 RepID=UPI0015E10BFE|nr:LysR family transcriptional regulator [Secundilactobacillus pentosiphilus]
MDINKLRTFLTIAKYGSFRSAAEKLFLSPRAVSKQMDQIENELGVKLFNRQKNNTSLTKLGTEFIVTAEDIVNSYTDAYNKIQMESASDSNKIILGFSSQNQATFVQQVFEKFLTENPDVQIELREESGKRLQAMVAANRLHLAVTPEYEPDTNHDAAIGVKKLVEDEMVVGVSKLNPLSKTESIDLELLRNRPVLYYNNSESTYLQDVFYKKYDGIFSKRQIQRVSSIEQRDLLIAIDRGIGFFPRPLASVESTLNPMIKFLNIDNELNTYYSSVLIYNKKEDNPVVRQFIASFK